MHLIKVIQYLNVTSTTIPKTLLQNQPWARTWRNPRAAAWGGRRRAGTLERWLRKASPRFLSWADTDPCDWASVSSDRLWRDTENPHLLLWTLTQSFPPSGLFSHCERAAAWKKKEKKKDSQALTDCSSPLGSSECTASACLPPTPAVSDKLRTWRWEYSAPGVSKKRKYKWGHFQDLLIKLWFRWSKLMLPAALWTKPLSLWPYLWKAPQSRTACPRGTRCPENGTAGIRVESGSFPPVKKNKKNGLASFPNVYRSGSFCSIKILKKKENKSNLCQSEVLRFDPHTPGNGFKDLSCAGVLLTHTD